MLMSWASVRGSGLLAHGRAAEARAAGGGRWSRCWRARSAACTPCATSTLASRSCSTWPPVRLGRAGPALRVAPGAASRACCHARGGLGRLQGAARTCSASNARLRTLGPASVTRTGSPAGQGAGSSTHPGNKLNAGSRAGLRAPLAARRRGADRAQQRRPGGGHRDAGGRAGRPAGDRLPVHERGRVRGCHHRRAGDGPGVAPAPGGRRAPVRAPALRARRV